MACGSPADRSARTRSAVGARSLLVHRRRRGMPDETLGVIATCEIVARKLAPGLLYRYKRDMTNTNKPTAKWYRDPDAQGDRNGSWYFGATPDGDHSDDIASVHPMWSASRGIGIGKPDYYLASVRGVGAFGKFPSIRAATKACDERMAADKASADAASLAKIAERLAAYGVKS